VSDTLYAGRCCCGRDACLDDDDGDGESFRGDFLGGGEEDEGLHSEHSPEPESEEEGDVDDDEEERCRCPCHRPTSVQEEGERLWRRARSSGPREEEANTQGRDGGGEQRRRRRQGGRDAAASTPPPSTATTSSSSCTSVWRERSQRAPSATRAPGDDGRAYYSKSQFSPDVEGSGSVAANAAAREAKKVVPEVLRGGTGVGVGVRRPLSLGRSPSSAAMENRAWHGVSGVPGLGISIPANRRPQSACCDVAAAASWGAGARRRQSRDSASIISSSSSVSSGKSASKLKKRKRSSKKASENAEPKSWSPRSLLLDQKLEPLPRITPTAEQPAATIAARRRHEEAARRLSSAVEGRLEPRRLSCHWDRLAQEHSYYSDGGHAQVGRPQLPSLPPVPRPPLPTPPLDPQYETLKKTGKSRDDESGFYQQLFKKRSLITGSGGENSSGHDSTFDSMEIPFAIGGGNYRSIREREGDYSYAYDTSMSPAFIIRYNAEEDDKDGANSAPPSVIGENIYEEIPEVRKRFAAMGLEGVDDDDFGDGFEAEGESAESSGSSKNADSGVDAHSSSAAAKARKFSSDTLDLGPRSLLMNQRQHSKFSSSSNGSSTESFHSSSASRENRAPNHVASSWSPSEKEDFSEVIRRHHAGVVDRLRPEDLVVPRPEDESPGADGDSGILVNDGQRPRRASTSVLKLLAFARGRSSASLGPRAPEEPPKTAATPPERRQSESARMRRRSGSEGNRGWLRKSSLFSSRKAAKQQQQQPLQPLPTTFQRARATGEWEDLREDPGGGGVGGGTVRIRENLML